MKAITATMNQRLCGEGLTTASLASMNEAAYRTVEGLPQRFRPQRPTATDVEPTVLDQRPSRPNVEKAPNSRRTPRVVQVLSS